MSQWPTVKLGDAVSLRGESIVDFSSVNEFPFIGLEHMAEGGGVAATSSVEDFDPKSAKSLYRKGDLLFGRLRPNLRKVALADADGICSTDITVLTPKQDIDHRFLYFALLSHHFYCQVKNNVNGINLPRINAKRLLKLTIPLPPLEEQRRIARILDASQKNILAAKFKINQVNNLRRRISNLYGTDNSNRITTLSTIAEITSGITKGRKIKGNTPLIDTPYLAVSNVKDGYLDLSAVKSIPITATEQERYLLKSGDILLTEGGDPDKLGRGAIWRNEIDGAIHQNHIFKVRLKNDSHWNENALLAVIRSDRSREHFVRSAKQTTGIATINKRQLSSTPIPELSAEKISLLSSIEVDINYLETKINKEISLLEELHQSLATRAFTGQL